MIDNIATKSVLDQGRVYSDVKWTHRAVNHESEISFELSVTEILRIKLQYLKIQIPVEKKIRTFYRISGVPPRWG